MTPDMTIPLTALSENSSDINFTDNQNETNRTDYHTRYTLPPTWSLEYAILAVMVTALAVNGLIGNTSVLIVYFRRRDNLASNTFIKVLASVDLLVCSFVMPYTIIYELHLVTSDVMCRSCELILHFCIFASNITLVAVATERYIAVCQISTKVDTHCISVGIWVIIGLSTVLGVPSIGTFSVVHSSEVQDVKCRFPHDYTTGMFCHFTYSIMGKTLVTVYQALSALLFYVTVLIIVVLYSIIYYVLWKKTKLRRKMLSRTAYKSDTESISKISSCELQRVTRLARRLQFGQSSGACRPDTYIPNDDISGRVITDNLTERQSDSQNSQESTNNRNNNGTKPRRKIRFTVSAQSGRSEKLKRKRYYHRRTAKMLFLCTVIYFVTWLPFWIDVFGFTNCLLLRYLFFIGNATNPIVYGIVNEQVRRAFKKLFLECLRKWFGVRGSE